MTATPDLAETGRAPLDRLLPEARPWRSLPVGPTIVGIALLTLFPLFLTQVGAGRFLTQLLLTALVYAVVVQAWNLVLGVSGIFSVAQLVFYAVGGYTTAVLSTQAGASPWIGVLVGGIAAAVAALLVGLPVLRMRGIYVVLLTLGMNELLRNYIQTGPDLLGRGNGLRTPRLFEGGAVLDPLLMHYFVALVIFLSATYVVWWLINSPIGTAFTALRDSETYAASRGIDRYRFRMLLFVTSAFLTGLAGAFMTHYQGLISPAVLDFSFLITLQTMIVVGGWGTFAGPILGTFVVVALREAVQPLGAGFTQVALGALLTGIVVTSPRGLWPVIQDRYRRIVRAWGQME